MKFKPLRDLVVVELAEKESKSGIILTNTDKENSKGKVICLGLGVVDGKEFVFSVKIGDEVMFPSYCGEDYEIEGENYRVIEEGQILGILN